jgi:hypothetical protein
MKLISTFDVFFKSVLIVYTETLIESEYGRYKRAE